MSSIAMFLETVVSINIKIEGIFEYLPLVKWVSVGL